MSLSSVDGHSSTHFTFDMANLLRINESTDKNYLAGATLNRDNSQTQIAQATTCMTIKAIATGQLAPGMPEPA